MDPGLLRLSLYDVGTCGVIYWDFLWKVKRNYSAVAEVNRIDHDQLVAKLEQRYSGATTTSDPSYKVLHRVS